MYVQIVCSKEAKDGGAVHLGGGGEGRPRLVRGLRLQDPQWGHGTLQLVVFSLWISKALRKVMFFLAATVKLQEDDNACLWIPTFLVPAFLSTIVAVYFVMVFVFDFVNVIVFAWMLSSTLNLSLSWSIKHL